MLVDNTGQSVQQDHDFTWNLLLSPHMKSAPLSASAAKKHSSWGASDPSSSLLHEIICVMMRERWEKESLLQDSHQKGKMMIAKLLDLSSRVRWSPQQQQKKEKKWGLVIICLLNADALDQRGCKTRTALYLPCTHTKLHSHTHSPSYQKIVKTFVWRFNVVQFLRWLVGPYLAAVYLKIITMCNRNTILTKGWFTTR